MSEITSRNKEIMRRMYEEMWNEGKAALAKEFFAQPEGVQRFVNQFLSSFPDLQHTIEEMIAEDDRVAVRFTANGTHTGTWLRYKPTNKAIQYTGLTLARITGGRIVEHHTWWDKAGLIEQLDQG